MSKYILILSFLLLTLSIVKSAKEQSDVNAKNKDTQVKGKIEDQKDDQDNMNTVDLNAAMNECNNSFRIDMSFIKALNEGGSFPDETDKTPKCYVRCVMEMTRVASEDGEYDAAQAAVIFAGKRNGKEIDNIEEFATGCSKRDESCKCERAYQFVKCLMEKEIEFFEKSME